MSSFFAAQYVNSDWSPFNFINIRGHLLEESPKLVGDLFNDGYITEACTVLTYLGMENRYRKYFHEALSFIRTDDHTNVCVQIQNGSIRVYWENDEEIGENCLARMSLTKLKNFSFDE